MALAFGLHSLGSNGVFGGPVTATSLHTTGAAPGLTGAGDAYIGARATNNIGLWLGVATPSASNYAVGSSPSGDTTINASIGQSIILTNNNSVLGSIGASGISFGGSVSLGTTAGSTVTIGNTTGAQIFGSNNSCGMGVAPNALTLWGSGSLTIAHLATATVGVQTQMGTSASNAMAPGVANVNTTSTASGAGASDLITYTLPANALSAAAKGVRIKAWGTTANNANAKTVALVFGGTTLVTKALTASIAGLWELSAVVFKTGASTQAFEAEASNSGGTTVAGTDGATVAFQMNVSTAAETDTSSIVIKGRATVATSASDIVQKGILVEFFN